MSMNRFVNQLKNILAGLFVLVLLAGLVYGLLMGLMAYLRSLQSEVAGAIVAAGFAGLVSIVSLAISKAYETRAAVKQDLRAKKLPVYEGIVRTLFAVMFAERLGKKPVRESELIQWFAETTEKLSIWGSDDLVLAFGRFKNGFSEDTPSAALFGFEDLLLAIRKDLGHSGRKLGRGSILRLFVTDIDVHLKT